MCAAAAHTHSHSISRTELPDLHPQTDTSHNTEHLCCVRTPEGLMFSRCTDKMSSDADPHHAQSCMCTFTHLLSRQQMERPVALCFLTGCRVCFKLSLNECAWQFRTFSSAHNLFFPTWSSNCGEKVVAYSPKLTVLLEGNLPNKHWSWLIVKEIHISESGKRKWNCITVDDVFLQLFTKVNLTYFIWSKDVAHKS